MYPLRVERMGVVPYEPMLARQDARRSEILAGTADDTLFLLEHERVITAGRNAQDDNLLFDEIALEGEGIAVVRTGRGGDFTYHGPGQVVGYPVMLLRDGERDIQAYVTRLEALMIAVVADFGITAQRVPGLRGIWVGDAKIGAIGVRVVRWATTHGFALNVDVDLNDFSYIIPCGLKGRGVCSLSQLLGRQVTVEEVNARVVVHAAEQLGRAPYDAVPERFPEAG